MGDQIGTLSLTTAAAGAVDGRDACCSDGRIAPLPWLLPMLPFDTEARRSCGGLLVLY